MRKFIVGNAILVFGFFVFLLVTAFAWTGPTAAPPGSNVPAPINVGNPASPTDQRKDGRLSIKAPLPNPLYDLRVAGGARFDGGFANFGDAFVSGFFQTGISTSEIGGGGEQIAVGRDPMSPGIKMLDGDADTSGGPHIDMTTVAGHDWDVRLWNNGVPNKLAILGWQAFGGFPSDHKDIRLVVGTTNNTAAPGARIFVVDTLAGEHPSATSWTARSSRRWKEDIQPLQGTLNKVLQLQGVSFTWKSTKERDIGFIAEDVGNLFPEIVSYEKNGKDAIGMDYGRLTAVLVEAIKEQEEKIDIQNAQIQELKSRLEKLEAVGKTR